MQVMRIEDEFGHYFGTAVVDDLKLRRVSHYLAGETGHHPEPVCRIIRVWNDYDEDYAETLAEGFIEGWGHHKDDDYASEQPSTLGMTSGSFAMGAEKEPAADMQSLVSSMSENQTDVTSPAPWEQGFKWDGSKNGWTRNHGDEQPPEFIPYTDSAMMAFNKWQDEQDRPGTNTR